MNKNFVLIGGLLTAVFLSNIGGFVRDGQALDGLRNGVLRLHILADSDSERDQNLKLKVRDALLESGILNGADSLESAEKMAVKKLDEIERTAEKTLRENGCNADVSAEITEMYFDEKVYGDITMPAGDYTALRVKIGSAEGHNWWCVMYPPLCVPCAVGVDDDEAVEEVFFSEKENDIINNPQKYKVRFAVWDKLKSIFG
ncbi:MAG: stage II sporulation protein R [Ruminococcus sp.]|nr:stage II sporulation protein R [Ruminococcus sp.]